MNKEKKVYSVGYKEDVKDFIYGAVMVDDPHEADIIVFWGGTDISSLLYGEQPHKHAQKAHMQRDLMEIGYYTQFPNALKLGVCRGGQLLTALNGGQLIQHVTNHLKNHKVIFNGKEMTVSSAHHQMMYPFDLLQEDYQLLAYSRGISGTYEFNDEDILDWGDEEFLEPEIIWYPKTRSLAIQGHPEWMHPQDDFIVELNDLLNSLMYD